MADYDCLLLVVLRDKSLDTVVGILTQPALESETDLIDVLHLCRRLPSVLRADAQLQEELVSTRLPKANLFPFRRRERVEDQLAFLSLDRLLLVGERRLLCAMP